MATFNDLDALSNLLLDRPLLTGNKHERQVFKHFTGDGSKPITRCWLVQRAELLSRRWDLDPVRTDLDRFPEGAELILSIDQLDGDDPEYLALPIHTERVIAVRGPFGVCADSLLVAEYGLTAQLVAALAAIGLYQTQADDEWLWFAHE